MTVIMTPIIIAIIIAIITLIYLGFNNKNNISKGMVGIILSIFPFPLLFIGSAIGLLICPIASIIFGIMAIREDDKSGKIAVIIGVLAFVFAIYIFIKL